MAENTTAGLIQSAIKSAAIEGARKALADPETAELLLLIAKHRKMTFDAHIKAGFTSYQALQMTMGAKL